MTNRSVSRMTPTLKLLPERQMGRGPERDLDAAAADVDDDRRAAADVHAVPGRQMDEPGFFGSGNHPDADAGLAIDLGNEVAAVLGLARGAGGRRDDLVDLVGVGQALELGQGLERGRHGGWGQAAAVQAAGAEPDHVLFAVNDFEGQVRPDLDHDHVDGVGADVDGGDAHEGRQLNGSGSCCVYWTIYTMRSPAQERSDRRHPTMNTRAPV